MTHLYKKIKCVRENKNVVYAEFVERKMYCTVIFKTMWDLYAGDV